MITVYIKDLGTDEYFVGFVAEKQLEVMWRVAHSKQGSNESTGTGTCQP